MQLSPLNLLTIEHSEQDVIRCLMRRPNLTACEISGYTNIPKQELENILMCLVQKTRLSKTVENGKSVFSVGYGRRSESRSARSSGLLDSLFA